jgi:fatty-acid peroxygenase
MTALHRDPGMTLSAGPIPRLPGDHTLGLLSDPYRFIGRHCESLGTDAFETRLLGQRTLCMTGPAAAELFYDARRFQREGAAPEPLRATLFGEGTVQGLDGARHRQRKALFVDALGESSVEALVRLVREEWEQALDRGNGGRVSLYRWLHPVLTRAVTRWLGMPVGEAQWPDWTRQLVMLFDGAASGVLGHLRTRRARAQAERHVGAWIEALRVGRLRPPVNKAVQAFAWHTDMPGGLLSSRQAAAEVLNLLRPVVAVSVYLTFVAHALHQHPHWRSALRAAPAGPDARAFAQEVRRHCPFFPAVAARVRQAFDWNGMRFLPGRRALLDLYGTNHDARSWKDPLQFLPERWQGRRPTAFEFVPQGGAEAAKHHRCPGEDLTLRLMLLGIEMFTVRMQYEVPPQNLDIAMDRLPALPADEFLVERMTRAG